MNSLTCWGRLARLHLVPATNASDWVTKNQDGPEPHHAIAQCPKNVPLRGLMVEPLKSSPACPPTCRSLQLWSI